jgi:Fe-S cluster assembly protein SufD
MSATATEVRTDLTKLLEGWRRKAEERAAKSGEPAWAIERRRQAGALAEAIAFPSLEDELWRRTDFRSLDVGVLDPFAEIAHVRSIGELPASLEARLDSEESRNTAVVAHWNGVAIFEQSHPQLEAQGVVVCSLERALREHGDKLEAKLGSLLHPDFDRYVAIAEMVRSGGAFVWVPDGVDAAAPIRLIHGMEGGGRLATPRTVVVLGRNARATVIEEQASETAEGISFHDTATEVFVGDHAKLIFATLQDWGRNVFHYSNQRAQVGRQAELQWIQTVLGGRMVKANSYFDLAGSGAQAFVHGFMFGDQRQHFHLHTLQRHLVDHTTSDLLIKGCLKDRARSVYQGLIQVSEGAQRTDAYQANRNLLLSNHARADSIPGLEILANDVRCTHGATIGHVDDEQMYYLMARGLPRAAAQRLIVEGFFAPVLDRIPLEPVREQLRQVIHRKIG